MADDRSCPAAVTTSWKLAVVTDLPGTAGTTTNDFLSGASTTRASLPALPAVATRSATTLSVFAGSVRSTASTSREETSERA